MRTTIIALLIAVAAAFALASCAIGGDEPWDDTDTGTEGAGDADSDSDGDGDSDTDSLDFADAGVDGGVDTDSN
jgi:hypothetical protein